MAARTLKIKIDGDSAGLAQATEKSSATLEKFNKSAEDTRGKMDKVGGSAEGLADSSSLATGALGALASGFELVGLEEHAAALQKASLATDFLSGVGDSLTLVTQKLGLAKAKDTVQTIASTVATKAKTAATKSATIAQKAMNIALKANPIGIIITLLAGLVGALILAYKKSETFRKIVDGAFDGVRNAAKAVTGWIRENFPPLFDKIAGPFRNARETIGNVWTAIREGARGVKTFVTEKFNELIGFFGGLPERVSKVTGGLWNGIESGFKSVLNSIIRMWNNFSLSVDIPDKIPGLPDSFTVSTPNIGYLARGGYAAPGRTYVVGENGPELLTMGGRGFVTPNGQLESMGSGDLRQLAGRLLELLSELMETEITAHTRGIKRRALAGTGVAR